VRRALARQAGLGLGDRLVEGERAVEQGAEDRAALGAAVAALGDLDRQLVLVEQPAHRRAQVGALLQGRWDVVELLRPGAGHLLKLPYGFRIDSARAADQTAPP